MDEMNRELSSSFSWQHQLEELQERASKDTLSGLLNRGTAELCISQRLKTKAPDELCALFIIDMDNFKAINDTLGHQAGDQAIRHAAQSLSRLFRSTDIVGRLGGDEFLVFFSGRITPSLVRRKGREICQHLQLTLGTSPSITSTASVGIYLADGNNQTFDGMYQAADLALYKAKKAGKHGFFIKYGEAMAGSGEEENFLPVSVIPLGGLLEYIDSGVALLEMGDPIRLIYVSPSFCRLIGADLHTYSLPCLLSQVVHPDDLQDLEQTLRRGLAQNGSADHTHRVSVDGKSWHWWRIRATQIEYHSPHPVMLLTATDISPFKENEQALREINQRLQSAFEQTAQDMWEVNLTSRIFTLFHFGPASRIAETSRGEFPEDLLANGWIHPSSTERFRLFARELLSGRMQGYGNFIIQYPDTGRYGWATLSYRRLSDGTGKAVGILEKLPQGFSGPGPHSLPRRILPDPLTPYLTAAIHGNLSRNSILELWAEGKDLSGTPDAASCTEVLSHGAAHCASAEDRRALGWCFDREQLLEAFARGECWFSLEYRRADSSGGIHWVNRVMDLAEDPLTRDIYLFTYLFQSDLRHQREEELGIEIQRDPVTLLYNQTTTRALVETQLQKNAGRQCAAAILQLGGMDQLNPDSACFSRQNCRRLAQALCAALGPQCIVGQFSPEKLLVFFPQISSRSHVKRILEDVFAFVRLSLSGLLCTDQIYFVAGGVCTRAGGASYPAMAAQCAQLCETWHGAAVDTVVFTQDDSDWNWSELQHADPRDRITIYRPEMIRPMTEGEKDVALQCVSAMLSSDSLDSSVYSVLSAVGRYYQADRAFLLVLAENRRIIAMPHEWTSPQKSSIQQALSGLPVDQFPMLRRCMEEQAPVFLTRDHPLCAGTQGSAAEPWHFSVFPLLKAKVTVGFLCIENGRKHLTDVSLFATLIPHLLKEPRRFRFAASDQPQPL